MTTFYLDLEAGSDAADGLSFANRWRTINSGATAARTAPGDTIRVMASTDPTSVGSATWTGTGFTAATGITSSTNASPIVVTATSHGLANGDTVQITGHTTNTNANGTWEVANITGTTFELVGSTGNGAGGSTGTLQKRTSSVVKLATACTLNVACPGNGISGGRGTKTNWTQSANVTCTVNTTTFRQGGECQQIAVAAGFATGKAAYFATGTLDLSGYQQISFWISQTAGSNIATTGDISLRLCTDTIGAVSVHTIAVPPLAVASRFACFTVDLATNLNSAIASIALYVDVDRGAQTFLIDNIIAVKAASSADSLSLTSLIGKNTSTESFWAIQSISDTRVLLDFASTGAVPSSTTTQRGYWGTTESVTTYKRQPIKIGPTAAQLTSVQSTQEAGSSGNLITYSGGWNRTDMSTQTGETWVDGVNGYGNFLDQNQYIAVDRFGSTRFNVGLSRPGNATFSNCTVANCLGNGFEITTGTAGNTFTNCFAHQNGAATAGIHNQGTGAGDVLTNVYCLSNGTAGYNLNGSATVGTSPGRMTASGFTCSNNSTNGIRFANHYTSPLSITNLICSKNGNNGVEFALATAIVKDVMIDNFTADSNGLSAIAIPNGSITYALNVLIKNFTWTGSAGFTSSGYVQNLVFQNGSVTGTGISWALGTVICRNVNFTSTEYSGFTPGAGQIVYSENHDQTANNHQITMDGGTIVSSIAQRHTTSDFSWAVSPTNAVRAQYYPMVLRLGRIAVNASSLVTVSVWIYRTNTGLTSRLVCKGQQIAGVSTDVVDSASGSANTWEQLVITFTPTEAGVVEITHEAYGGTTYTVYVDDFDWSQA